MFWKKWKKEKLKNIEKKWKKFLKEINFKIKNMSDIKENVTDLKNPEIKIETPVEIFVEEKTTETPDSVLKEQKKQVIEKTDEVVKKGEYDKETLEKHEAIPSEINDFVKKEKEFEEEAIDAKDEYESFITPGVFETEANIKREEKKRDFKNENKEDLAEEKENKKEKDFVKYLEEKKLSGEGMKDEYLEIKNDYKQKLASENKKPKDGETWDELILKEADKNYSDFIKSKVGEGDKIIMAGFQESNENKLLPLKERQKLLNTLFKNPNKLYANKNGEMGSVSDYLKDYYKNIGINVEIKFKTIDPDVKKSLARWVLEAEYLYKGDNKDKSFEKSYNDIESNDEKISYILNDEIAIPHLIIEKDDVQKEVPLIAGSFDVHMPLRSEKKNESGERIKKGHFIQSQVVHAPESGCTIQKIAAFNIHEIDHAIKEVMPTDDQKTIDQELIVEGTAEKAAFDFMSAQHNHLKNELAANNFDGYDYQANLQKVIAGAAVGEETSKGHEHRYAQGYIIAKGYEEKYGEEKYRKLFYTGELNIDNELGDVKKIREEIDKKLKEKKGC